MKIVFSEISVKEIEDTKEYYELQKMGLGSEFEEQLKEHLNTLYSFPEMYPKVSLLLYKIVMKKFPYNIYYNLNEDLITIVSIAHQHRKPFYTVR